jgi:predicted MarR family transcription regulator
VGFNFTVLEIIHVIRLQKKKKKKNIAKVRNIKDVTLMKYSDVFVFDTQTIMKYRMIKIMIF